MSYHVKGYAAQASTARLGLFEFDRRSPRPDDVVIRIQDINEAYERMLKSDVKYGAYNRATEAHDWKRRGERLVRASGMPFTIVRPGWFDYNAKDQHRLVFLQGDRRHAGDPSDGVVARAQIAEVLVHCLTSDAARGKTIELVAEQGPAPADLDAVFAEARADAFLALDAILDKPNMPMTQEPPRVREDYERLGAR